MKRFLSLPAAPAVGDPVRRDRADDRELAPALRARAQHGRAARAAASASPAPSACASRRSRRPRGEIPVLVWHGIVPARDGYSTSQRAFARQLALLKASATRRSRCASGRTSAPARRGGLPAKPILLTFDDGRLDSYRGADAVLKQLGMRAAMFVITGEIEKNSPFYLTWAELHKMQPRAAGTSSRTPTRAPRRRRRRRRHERPVLRGAPLHPLGGARDAPAVGGARQRRPVRGARALRRPGHRAADVRGAVRRLRAARRERPAIPPLLSDLLTRQFGSFFIQADDDDPGFTVPGTGAAERYELRTGTSLDDLYGWLSRHSKTDETRN